MGSKLDGYNGVAIQQTIVPATISGNGDNTEGAAVARTNYNGILHTLSVGAAGDTWSGSLYTDVILQHGLLADSSDMAAVTDSADFIGTMETQTSGIVKVLDAAADGSQVYKIAYRGVKPYSRLHLDRTGNHATGTPMSASAVKTNPRFQGATDVLPTA